MKDSSILNSYEPPKSEKQKELEFAAGVEQKKKNIWTMTQPKIWLPIAETFFTYQP